MAGFVSGRLRVGEPAVAHRRSRRWRPRRSVGPGTCRRSGPHPVAVRNGPRVHLPNREYFLSEGPITVALAWTTLEGQTPNLWWPDDRAWCVASEIDLPWTYLGGSEAVVAEVLGRTETIEALRSAPDDEVNRVEPWVEARAAAAASELLETGHTTVTTGAGIDQAWLQPHQPGKPGTFRDEARYPGGSNFARPHCLPATRPGSPNARR
jgi:hypothetical protein